MARGGGNKKRYQYCTDSLGTILYLRALQGHSGRSLIDPTLQDNVIIPVEQQTDSQSSFYLWTPWTKTIRILTRSTWKHRVLHNTCKKAWKKHQNTVYWVDINLALKKGLKFYQTRSKAIILHETLPAYCIPKVVRMDTGEVIHEKVFASLRSPPKISLKHDWMKELGSEVARQPEGEVVQQSKSSRSSQPNPNPDHDRTGKRVVCPQAGASQARFSHDSTNFNVEDETKLDRTEKPFVCRDANHEQSMPNEVDIDFRIPGLPHSVVKQAENYRVRELVKKIENHPHRQSLRRDLQQNKAYSPFSTTSKKMIQDMDNVELFELFETDPKTQCKECLSYWSEGIVYCTCGHLLKESAANRGAIQKTLDLLSIPNYVIKKGRPHGHRYGKTPQQKEYHQAHNLKKRCIKKRKKGIHDRFLKDPEFRAFELEHDRDEEVCIKMDDLADKDFSHYMTESEYFRYKQNWWISGNTGPLRNRSDFNDALTTLNRLHQESGERQLRPMK